MSASRRFAVLTGLVALYFVAGRFGLSLAFVNESATALWPPTGIAIAACLLAGTRLWPAVFAGAFLVNLTTTEAILPSILIAAGNTAECVLAALLVGRFCGGPAAFDKTTGILGYLVVVTGACAVAATAGVAALVAGDLAEPALAPTIWLTWWTGDLASAILLTPSIVTWARRRDRHLSMRFGVEALPLLLALVAVNYWVFGPTPAGARGYPLMFMTLPVQLWAAVRFGSRGASAAVLVTGAIATAGTLAGLGPFARGTTNESLLLLQAYLGVTMTVMLTLAAEVSRRLEVEHDIRQLNLDLGRRIEARSEELQLLHGRLVEAQAVAHIGSWEWDVAANSIWWSDEMYRVFGLPIGTPVGYERYLSLIHPDDRSLVQDVIGRSGQTAEPFTFEHRALKADGSELMLHSRGRVVTDSSGKVIRMLGIGHDITDRRRAEQERLELASEQAARREAEEANRMKDYFLAALSHELRTPLNAVVGWAQLLRKSTVDEALRQRALDAINRNVNIQAQLVSDILDVARIRSGTLSIEARPVAVQTIIDGALDIMHPGFVEKAIEVAVDIPGGQAVMGDAKRLQQVLWNLLSNAAKFVPIGGRITIGARTTGGAVEITVADNGPGIPEDFLPHVFEQFRQADPSVTRGHGGLGLGLTISQNLVHLHSGTIEAANRPDGGAIFTVRLPAATFTSA